jgi:DNA-binding MarR family transcriptional regulator
MKPFKVASLQTPERKQLQLAARELGHGLQLRSRGELASIRRGLSEVATSDTSEYAQGFLDAIEHVLAGLSAELKHRSAVAEDAASTRLRKNASKVLLALHAGCNRPTEIAEKTLLKPPAVSTELAELERELLVERVERAPGEDQRMSPRALTIRGMQVADELTRTQVSPAAEAARDIAPVFVAFINHLADESYLAPQHFEALAIERLGPVNGMFVCKEFMKHAESQQVISMTNSALTLTSPFYRRRLRDLLDPRSKDGDATLLEPMRRLGGDTAICLRATTAMRDHWKAVLSAHGMRNVFPWCRDDARAQQLPSPGGPYHIVWENPEVMTRDRDEKELRPFIEKATRQLCYVATDLQLPPGVDRIEFDAYQFAR